MLDLLLPVLLLRTGFAVSPPAFRVHIRPILRLLPVGRTVATAHDTPRDRGHIVATSRTFGFTVGYIGNAERKGGVHRRPAG